jgi:FKBP-type peptidyl-prolyl cis-trans isomerase
MNKIKIFALGCLLVALASCGHSDYKKTSTGLVYEIIKNGKGDLLKQGEYLKVNFKFILNDDSVLQNTFGKMPAYGPVDTSRLNMHSFTDILPMMRVGDSAIIVQSVDTLKKLGQIPPADTTFKPGSTIKMYVKIEAKFKDQQAVEADYKQEEKNQLQREITAIDAELKKKGITATKSANGVFVQVTNPGNGPQVDTGK